MEKNSPALVAWVDVVRLAEQIAEQEGTNREREISEDVVIHVIASRVFRRSQGGYQR